MDVIRLILGILRASILPRAALAAENPALCRQLAALQRPSIRPRLRRRDQLFSVWPSRVWMDWRSCLVTAKPDTVIKRPREGFRRHWHLKSCKKPRRRLGFLAAPRRRSGNGVGVAAR